MGGFFGLVSKNDCVHDLFFYTYCWDGCDGCESTPD